MLIELRNELNVQHVSAVPTSGDRLKLVTGLTAPNHAEYIEQQIEGRLGIKDRPETGEMGPGDARMGLGDLFRWR